MVQFSINPIYIANQCHISGPQSANTVKNDYPFSLLLTAEVLIRDKRRASCENMGKVEKLLKLFFYYLIKA